MESSGYTRRVLLGQRADRRAPLLTHYTKSNAQLSYAFEVARTKRIASDSLSQTWWLSLIRTGYAPHNIQGDPGVRYIAGGMSPTTVNNLCVVAHRGQKTAVIREPKVKTQVPVKSGHSIVV